MVGLACAALLGVCAVLSAPRLPTDTELVTGLALAAVFALRRIGAPLFSLALAVAVATLDARARLDDWLAPELERVTLQAQGTIVSVPQRRGDGVRFVFAPEPGAAPRLPRQIEITWYDPAVPPRAAQRWSLELRLRRPRGFANPGGTDFAARLLRARIGATGYVRAGHALPARPGDEWRHPLLRIRAGLADAIDETLGDRAGKGIVTGLAVGLQDALSVDQWRDLSRTGASHLMAISGLHVGMVGALVASLGAWLQRRFQLRGSLRPARDVALCAGCVASGLYALLAGASVPTLRTYAMIVVASFALLRRRNLGVIDGLALGVIVVLAIDPLAPLASGFWLSFGAVLAIVAGVAGYTVTPSLLTGYLRTQFVVTVGLVPIVAGAFGSVSLVSVPVNLLAIPLYTLVVVPLVLVGTALAALSALLGRLVLTPTAALIESTWPLFSLPAGSRWSTWTIPALDAGGWLLLLVGVAAAIAPLARPTRLAGLALIACVCLWTPDRPPPGVAEVTVLDVGQGLAVAVVTRRHVLVYDTGPAFRSGSDAGQLVVLPFLSARGWRSVDALVISHDDADHAGGAPSIVEALPVHRAFGGEAARDASAAARCDAGHWSWDGVEFEWLTPDLPHRFSDNDRSCVLMVTAGGRRLLLPGDIESAGERELLAGHLPPVDVVIVPHHGSRSSSTEAFVARTSPTWAIVSAGYLNRWNFPRREVVTSWQSVGARVLNTADAGAIQFRLGAGSVPSPTRWRAQRPRFWHGGERK